MIKATDNNPFKRYSRSGIALIIVLLILTILSIMAYTLTNRLMMHNGSHQYIIDYQNARYACDSAVKFALTAMADMNDPVPIIRNDALDFSDLFDTNEVIAREIIFEWSQTLTPQQAKKYMKHNTDYGAGTFDINGFNDINDISISDLFEDNENQLQKFDANDLQIPGPYGPPWPFIAQPINLDISNAKVTIEMHDENAKYPLGWMMLDDPKVRRQIVFGFQTLCEWVDVNEFVEQKLEDELVELAAIKEFKTEFKDITITKRMREKVPTSSRARNRGRRRSTRTRYRTITKKTKIPASVHYADFAKLYHSSLIDTESLARPYYVSKDRKESALKYISLFGTGKVNINSAPRPVLEAAFAFGGLSDSVEISQAVIEQRQEKPFKDPNELRNQLYGYSDSIDKCRQYISTKSEIFTIRITAISGRAKASAVIAVKKNKNKIHKIVVLSG
jgi:hypothetical protein